MSDKVQLIKEEILRRKQSWQHSDKQYEHGGKDVCDYLLGFIDSIPEENHFEDKSEMVIEETTIVNDWQYGKDPDHAVIPAIHQRIDGFNVGDKVRIIIVKTEQQ